MTPAPKRRWFHCSFSLRTLFVIVTLTAALSSAYFEARKANRLDVENAFLNRRIGSLEKVNRGLVKAVSTARQRGYLERQMREPANQPLPAHWLEGQPNNPPAAAAP